MSTFQRCDICGEIVEKVGKVKYMDENGNLINTYDVCTDCLMRKPQNDLKTEKIKIGFWIPSEGYTPNSPKFYQCSVCKGFALETGFGYMLKSNFCPHYGARMAE